jgi:pimeloyl-ACP methyl ester carboxylesterase
MYLVLAALLAFAPQAQGEYQLKASGVDRALLESDARLTVTDTADFWQFSPTAGASRTAMVFLPGASVEPVAYVPLARKVAERGYRAYVVKLPPPTAPLDAHKAASVARTAAVVRADRFVERWLVVGHSLGGAIAAQFVHEHPKLVSGFVLVGTTHPTSLDLSTLDLDATKVVASNDAIAPEAWSRRNASLLPPPTRWVRVEGGNHSQFGWYGPQRGDGEATITRERQQELTLGAILAALSRVDGKSATR